MGIKWYKTNRTSTLTLTHASAKHACSERNGHDVLIQVPGVRDGMGCNPIQHSMIFYEHHRWVLFYVLGWLGLDIL